MDRLGAMRVFAKVAALGGFAEAGRALGMTRSAASKAVMDLENALGARLLDRTTRRVRPTDTGLAYYESCLDILRRVEDSEAQAASSRGALKGLLRVNAPTSFGALHLGPAIADFMIAFPELVVELTLDDRFIDPIAEGFDVTVRIAALADSSLVARRIAPARRVLVASPGYLARGRPQEPADLAHHACLSYGQSAAPERWRLWSQGREVSATINPVLCSNNGDVLRAAALAGRGIALLPTFLAGPDIASGRLAVVFDSYEPRDLAIHALYSSKRFLAAKTRAFIDFLVHRFGEAPEWDQFYLREKAEREMSKRSPSRDEKAARSPRRGTTLHARTIGEAWLDVASLILDHGSPGEWEGLPHREVELVTLDISCPDPGDALIARHANADWLSWMRENFTERARVAALGDARSYASRLFDYAAGGRNQLDWVVDRLRTNPNASDAAITTFEPATDTTYIPCVSLLDFWLRAGRLDLVVYAHSIDFGKKGFANLVQLAALQKHVAERLERPVGSLAMVVKSAHIYASERELMAGILAAARGDPV